MDKDKKTNRSVKIFYEKNPLYRSIYTDGAFGGVTPLNQINLSFYATRRPIPKSIEFELTEQGGLGKPISISEDSKIGIMREVEVCIYMNRNTAKEIYEFLKKTLENEK